MLSLGHLSTEAHPFRASVVLNWCLDVLYLVWNKLTCDLLKKTFTRVSGKEGDKHVPSFHSFVIGQMFFFSPLFIFHKSRSPQRTHTHARKHTHQKTLL